MRLLTCVKVRAISIVMNITNQSILINLEKTMVSVLYKELEYKVEKLKYKKVGGHAAQDENKIRSSSW